MDIYSHRHTLPSGTRNDKRVNAQRNQIIQAKIYLAFLNLIPAFDEVLTDIEHHSPTDCHVNLHKRVNLVHQRYVYDNLRHAKAS